MKKIIAIMTLIFVLISAVGAWGCNQTPDDNSGQPQTQEATIKGRTAYQMYDEFAKTKIDNVRVTMEVVSNGYMVVEKQLKTTVSTMTSVMDYKGDAFRSKSTITSMTLDDESNSFTTVTDMIYLDNVIYYNTETGTQTVKYKYVLTKNQFNSQRESASQINTGIAFTKDDFKGLEFIEDGDNFKMNVTIDSSKINDISSAILPDGYSMTLSDFVCELKFSADAKLLGMVYSCVQNVKIDGEVEALIKNNMSTKFTLEYDVIRSIDAPTDADKYIEVLPQ